MRLLSAQRKPPSLRCFVNLCCRTQPGRERARRRLRRASTHARPSGVVTTIAEAGNQNPQKPRHGKQGVLRWAATRCELTPIRKGPPSTSSAVVARSESARFWADWDGTVMEQRGRNRWQTFGSPKGGKWLDLAPNRCHRLPPVAVGIDGKEGVDGSSPSEGF